MERLIATITLIIAFIVMASIFIPDRTVAGPSRSMHAPHDDGEHAPAATSHDPAPAHEIVHHDAFDSFSTDPHHGLTSLGSIEDECYRVNIWVTDLGARYSVHEAVTGELLGTLLTAEQVAAQFPEFDLPTIDFSAPSTLMMAEPHEDW